MSNSKSQWVEEIGRYDVPHRRLKQISMILGEIGAKSVLDVGCGPGHLSRLLRDIRYVGCDFVRLPNSPFEFVQCDFNSDHIPANAGEFDAVVCSGILEYVEDVPTFVSALRNRIHPGGHLVASYFNMNHISRTNHLLRGRTVPAHPGWRGFHSPRDIRSILTGAGYKITRTIATRHAIGTSRAVTATQGQIKLTPARWYSDWLAHELIHVAKT